MPLRDDEADTTPCGDNICEECPEFEKGTCDTVKSDAEAVRESMARHRR